MDAKNDSEFTFVIQGAFHPNTLYAIPFYLKYGDVIVSTWKNSPPLIREGGIANKTHNPVSELKNLFKSFKSEDSIDRVKFLFSESLSKDDIHKKQIYNYQNCFYQFKSTLNGLEKVKTKYVIKLRSDELYSNFEKMIEKTLISEPKKMITTNTFFRRTEDFPWHPSDHVIVSETEHMINVFRRCVDFCLRGGFFSEEDLDLIEGNETFRGKSYETRLTKEKNYGNRRFYDKSTQPLMYPEMIIGMNHLLEKKVYIDMYDFIPIMKDNFDVVKNEDMGLIQISYSRYRADRYLSSTNLHHTDPYEVAHSVINSMEDIGETWIQAF